MNAVKPKSVTRLHKKMMLEWLGVPLPKQPQKVEDVDSLLESYKDNSPAAYQKAYDVIINKIISDKAEQKVIEYDDAVELIRL